MGNTTPCLSDDTDVFIAHVDSVHADKAGAEQAEFFES